MKANGGRVGQIPFGYRRVDKKMVEDPDEQETIRLVRELSGRGFTYKRICDHLVEHGRKNKRGVVKWQPSQIQRMLGR